MSHDSSRALACAALVVALGSAQAQPATGAREIYSCKRADGTTIRSDRPIVGCLDDLRVLNGDASVKRVVPRTLTDEERARAEAKAREDDEARRARQVEERADRALMHRYPDQARHDSARKEALDSARAAILSSEARIAELMRERQPLLDDAEFYKGKPLPNKLKAALDANDAALSAQKALSQNQQGEVVRINRLYDGELVKLRKLWGARPVG
jgi:hypothetical protein